MNSIFWFFKKEVLRMSMKANLPIERYCFEFKGDSGNVGEVVYLDELGDQKVVSGSFNYLQVITVSASSIISYSDNFGQITC